MMLGLLLSLTLGLLLWGRLPGALLLCVCLLPPLGGWLGRGAHRHTHGAVLSIDAQAQKSRLSRWHGGTKLCFCLMCSLLCVASNSLPVSLLVALSMAAVTVGGGRVPLRYYLSLLALPASFLLLGAVAVALRLSAAPAGLLDIPFGAGYLSVTPESQRAAILLLARAFGAASCLYFLSLSTPVHRIVSSLRRVGVPALVTELMYLIYRYIFILLEAQHQLQTAAAARLGYRSVSIGLKTMGAASLNVLFLSFRRASDCFAAMEARCYDGEITFLEEERGPGAAQLCFYGGYLAALLLAWQIGRRLGF